MPVDVQQRADAELGAAWRRCEAALPEGWSIFGLGPGSLTLWSATAAGPRPTTCDCCGQALHASQPFRFGKGDTPAAALDALTEALQDRQGAA